MQIYEIYLDNGKVAVVEAIDHSFNQGMTRIFFTNAEKDLVAQFNTKKICGFVKRKDTKNEDSVDG